jgi:hypothetical protein
MNRDRFDALAQSLRATVSRRRTSRFLAAIAACGFLLKEGEALGQQVCDVKAARVSGEKRKKRKKHKKRKHPKPTARCVTPCTTSTCGSFPQDCPLFPANNIWNARVDGLQRDAHSDDYVASMGQDTGLHADFGAGINDGGPIGIPFVTVPSSQPNVPLSLRAYANESDPGPYPIPADAPIEGGCQSDGDRHVLVVQAGACVLYELFNARPLAGGGWSADSAAKYTLSSNALRPAGWTSADAAGLPILPGLVRYEEIAAGAIEHALRFTAEPTRDEYVWPARHEAGSTSSANVPPMGQRFRLKAGFDVSGFSAANQVILTALKRYGMILADNGSDWFLSGVPDDRWDNDDLHELQQRVHGRDFEAVDCTPLIKDSDSGEAAPA